MDNHNEEAKYLNFGKLSIDVSNVAYGRIVKASKIWNETINKEDLQADEINEMTERVGLYLIRQEFIVLYRRYTLVKSIKEYIKRALLTVKIINRSTKAEYEEFQDWVYFTLTGKKKVSLETKNGILEIIENQINEITEQTNLNQEQCLELLQTLLREQLKPLTESIQDPKVS